MVSVILNQNVDMSPYALKADGTQFVSSAPMTVAQLIANYPPSATTLGSYARVTDLYGAVDDIMRCRWDGVAYRWVPQRPSFSAVNTATGGTINIIPLVTAPTLRMSSTLLSNMTFVPSTTNAFVGQQQRIIQEGSLGLFVSTITGLIGSNVSLLGNTTKILEYGPTGWFASG